MDRDGKYDLEKDAMILAATIDATLKIACVTRCDIMGGTVQSQKFIRDLSTMQARLMTYRV